MPELAEIPGPPRLTVVRRIAAGGMGTVYQAVQHGAEGFGKTVAVKMIREPYSLDPEFLSMFVGEAKLVADLVHQNIAQVHHLGRAGDRLYIVMEYVEGVNLGEFLARHRRTGRSLPVELAAYVGSRICRGLEYAHRKRGFDGRPLGIVHRDVSPGNVMLSSLGEIKLLDFGVAKARELMVDREGRRLFGKLSYMAPEQARGETTDNRSDLYAVGVLLWEMLVGRPPLAEVPEADRRAAAAAPRLPSVAERAELAPDLATIVDRALAAEPARRYQHAGAMGYDLEYLIYRTGYGPTIVTMERYLGELFAGRPAFRSTSADDPPAQLPDTSVFDKSRGERG